MNNKKINNVRKRSTTKRSDNSSLEAKTFYQGQMRTNSEAGALLIRKMIEEDYGQNHTVNGKDNVYKSLAVKLGKSEGTIRRWTYDWERKGGTAITFPDFLKLVSLTKSSLVFPFFESFAGSTAAEQANEYASLVHTIGKELVSVGTKFVAMSEKLSNP